MPLSGIQYLIINVLETLELLSWRIYDEEKGFWYIETPSRVLPRAAILQSGEIVRIDELEDDDETARYQKRTRPQIRRINGDRASAIP